ncbi:MAG: DUF5103 domain-containing protein [Bacteroidetes bacterium]|nr:DUF5103 domain-containing protein [Bacteroidota bacterium]
MREDKMHRFQKVLIVIYLFCFLMPTKVWAQPVENKDLVYDANIQTVLLYPGGDQLAPPIIKLGSTDKLTLSFDDLSNQSFLFKYTLIHCTKDWQTSDLDPMDYLEGFFEADITNYNFSLNAIPPYINYALSFPNRDIRIKRSGNYILKVYLDNTDDENVLFTKRFYVVEPLVKIDVNIPYYPKNLDFVRKKQQLDLKLFTPDLFNSEPELRMSVNIMQNGRYDNMKVDLKPTSLMLDQLNFDYTDGIVFDGGNQFRNFDMKSFYYQSMYISEIINGVNGYNVVLHTSAPRPNKPYSLIEDINGRKLIKARQGQNTSTEGEYAWVEFYLKMPRLKEGEIYLLGALNDWQLDAKGKMVFDNRINMYHGRLYLKQGYYDYLYAIVPNGESVGDVTIIEGDHWETKNQYTVYVYYREKVPEFDRLVGYSQFYSFDVSTE